LKDRFKLPWIADFRDPWLENPAYNTVPRLGIVKALNRKLEKGVLLSADTIICANEGIRRLTSSKVPPSASAKFTVITNGYDRSDVRPSTGKLQRFTASHFGTVYPHGFPFQLFEVFREMIDSDRSFARDFLFRARGIVGSDTLARLG
jgi:hypothetical protein